MQKKPLIVVGGPTATGKTSFSIQLAKKINGEIISADSMQVYKLMDIGTAKPTQEEMDGVKHHLIDIIYPDEDYSVAIFKEKAQLALTEIYANNKIPIVTGGTGFYINALVKDTDFSMPKRNEKIIEKYVIYAKEYGNAALHDILRQKDPISAAIIHPNNVKKVIRALEFIEISGNPISLHNEIERQKTTPYECLFFALEVERSKLYEKTDLRVDNMVTNGLVNEVIRLLEMGYDPSLVSMQGIGYKETLWFLQNKITIDEAITKVKTATRHYVKRQLTWFKRQTSAIWLNALDLDSNPQKFMENALCFAKDYNII